MIEFWVPRHNTPLSKILFFALSYNLHEIVVNCLRKINQINNENQKIAIISTPNMSNELTGIQAVFFKNNIEAIKVFFAELPAFKFSIKNLYNLLLSEHNEQGLYCLFQNCNIELINILFDSLIKLGFNSQNLLYLLSIISPRKQSFLRTACIYGYTEFIKTFFACLSKFEFDDEQLIYLLHIIFCLNRNKVSDIFAAFYHNQVKVVETFFEEIYKMTQKYPKLSELLIKNIDLFLFKSNESLGLFRAFFFNNHEMIWVFYKWMIKFGVKSKDLVKLLACRNKDDGPGLHVALQNGNVETIEVLAEMDELKKIDSTDLFEFFMCMKDGKPGLFTAIERGKTETVAAYLKLIRRFKPQNTTQLLLCEYHGVIGFFQALKYGYTEIVRLLLQENRQLKLQILLDLCFCQDNDGNYGITVAIKNGHINTVQVLLEEAHKTLSEDVHENYYILLNFVRRFNNLYYYSIL